MIFNTLFLNECQSVKLPVDDLSDYCAHIKVDY